MTRTPKKKVLITGINGFVGPHLAAACAARSWTVAGTIRSFRSDIARLAEHPAALLVPCDLTDPHAVAAAVKAHRPDYLFHLAAQSFVPASWTAPRQTFEVNVLGTLNVLEAVRQHSPDTVVQVAGSSEEYGLVHPHECPIGEAQPLRPQSPYGVSKAAADLLAQQYAASYPSRIVITRAFNHTGPGRGAVFAESDWAQQVARAEAQGVTALIAHGNLDAVRDYTDVRDIVRGYIAAVEHGQSGEVYNLCSGEGAAPTMHAVLAQLGVLATVRLELRRDAARVRPSDVPRLIGDGRKAAAALDWRPEIPFTTTLRDLLDYWRKRVLGGGVGFAVS